MSIKCLKIFLYEIAQVAPLYEVVPPKLYDGTESIVSYLIEERIKLGHEVSLFASADSSTSAQLIQSSPALRLDPDAENILAVAYPS